MTAFLSPALPGLALVFTIHARIDAPRSTGSGPDGERLHIPITGGTVEGPALRATILPGGSDWPLIRRDGTSAIEAVYSIEAEDGTLIRIRNRGLRVSDAQVLARLRAGEPVDPSEYYFRCAPEFDVPDGPHAWLRDALFIGSAAPGAGGVVIDVYKVS